MARYIDADALLSRLPDDLPYKASVKRVLMQAPTADVVQIAEVTKIVEEKDKEIVRLIRKNDNEATHIQIGAIDEFEARLIGSFNCANTILEKSICDIIHHVAEKLKEELNK